MLYVQGFNGRCS
jgi:hypothetical protein